MHFVGLARCRGWSKRDGPILEVGGGDFQDTGFSSRTWDGPGGRPSPPFLAVDSEAWCVNRITTPCAGVGMLAICEVPGSPWVAPAEVVPIIHVKGDRDEIVPKFRGISELRQPGLRSRTTAATF